MTASVEPVPAVRHRVDRHVLVERLVVAGVVVVVLAELVRVGAGVSSGELAASWQLLDRDILEHDLLRGLWYLHTQPPLHNAVVGAILWSPLPAAGTLFVLFGGCLLGVGLLVHHLARRWSAPGWVAAAAGCLAVVQPPLLSTIHQASYEVPLAFLVLALVALVDHHLARADGSTMVLIVGTGTVVVLTRTLFHPVWLAAVMVVLLVAKPIGRRVVVAAVLVPVLAVGALVVKNAVVVDRATLSTWTGFNMQRGITGPMDATAVRAAIDAGAVTTLAAVAPWQDLAAYAQWLDGCRPRHDHPALADPSRTVGDQVVPNFNAECYLPLYDESRANALTMMRREPAAYGRGRLDALEISFAVTPVGTPSPGASLLGERTPGETWMDRVVGPALVRQHRSIDMAAWNIPVFGDRLGLQFSWTLAVLAAVVALRTLLAAWHVGRDAVARRSWSGPEVTWLVAGGTVVFVIVGGDLVELGENGRFRSMLDPLLLVLAVRLGVEVMGAIRDRRAADDAAAAR